MKVLLALCFVILTAEQIAHAAPINNSTEPAPQVQTESTQEIKTDRTKQVPVEKKKKPVEPERKPKAPKVPKVVHPKGCEHYRQLISKYEWNVDVALKVMRAESGCNPSAIGDNRVIGGIFAPSCGLFQIRTLQGRPSCSQLQNPTTNVEWAIKLYRASGWQPWSVCNTGKVSCY